MLKSLFKKKSPRVTVLGIDGVPHTLLERFADEGLMPQVASLRERGTLFPMSASIPEVSSTSWSTFMTGVNPGRHGIYGFMELHSQNYGWKFPNFDDLKAKPLWQHAGEAGKRSIVLNLPSTYPARPLEGMLVAGFVALDLRRASYPEALYDYLNGMGYRLDVDTSKAAQSIPEFAADIMATFRKRKEAILHLYDAEQWDLFIATVTETDRLHHYLWAALVDEGHPQHSFFLEFYRELDSFIGEMARRAGDNPFLMLSDHGFTEIKAEVYLNAYLQEKRYLSYTKPEPESFADLAESSRAFVLDPSRVYLHRRGRFAHGTVDEAESQELRDAIARDLLALRVDGQPVIRAAIPKEDLYSGPCTPAAPDLVVLPHDGFDLKGTIKKTEITGRSALTGGHTREGAVFYVNRRTTATAPNIVDAGATVLSLLGLDTGDLDGSPLA